MSNKKATGIHATLKQIVGEEFAITDPLARFAYTHDASMFGGTEAGLVVRPGSTEKVSRIMYTKKYEFKY